MDALRNIIIDGAKAVAEFFGMELESKAKQTLSFFTEKINTFSSDIWNEPIIVGIVDFVGIISITVLIYSLLLLLADIAKQIDTVDWKTVFFTFVQTIIYTYTVRYIGMIIFSSAEDFIRFFDMEIDASNITLGDLLPGTSIAFQSVIITLIMAIFFVMNYYRLACMIIHIIASVFYIPFIVRGDTQKITEWITTAVSISITYIIQFLAMYVAVNMWVDGNLHLTIIFIMIAFCAGIVLKQFGYITGAKNGIASISRSAVSVAQGASILMK